jgi:hypothetical protein
MARRPSPRPPSPQQQAAALIQGEYAPVDYAYAASAARARREQAALAATKLALVRALQAGVKPVQETYDNAIQQQQSFAQNAARLLSAANPNAATQSDLASVNAPPEQRAQLASQANAQFPGQAGVLYTQQGAIPGASLLATRQADIAHLAGMPTLAALASEQTARALSEAQRRTTEQYQADRLRIASQLPQLASSIASAQADALYKQQQLQNQITQAALDRQFQARQAELNRQAQNAITPYQQAQLKLDQQRLNADIKNSKASATVPRIIGSSGSGYYTVGPGGKLKNLLPATSTGTAKSDPRSLARFTAHEIQVYKGQAATGAYNARHGAPATKTEPALAPLTYNQAVGLMLREGIPLPIAVNALNRVYPVRYKVTKRGTLVQTFPKPRR